MLSIDYVKETWYNVVSNLEFKGEVYMDTEVEKAKQRKEKYPNLIGTDHMLMEAEKRGENYARLAKFMESSKHGGKYDLGELVFVRDLIGDEAVKTIMYGARQGKVMRNRSNSDMMRIMREALEYNEGMLEFLRMKDEAKLPPVKSSEKPRKRIPER